VNTVIDFRRCFSALEISSAFGTTTAISVSAFSNEQDHVQVEGSSEEGALAR